VRDVFYAVHTKHGAPPEAPRTLRVEYEIGLNRYQKEWVCIEHVGYARGKAEAWWRARSHEPVPLTAADACRLAQAGLLAAPSHITVRSVAGEEFERITDYRLEPTRTSRR
jgi:DNA repair protein RadD